MFARLFVVLSLFFGVLSPAHAAELKIATVDFQRALNEVGEAGAVRAKLEGMFTERKAAIDKMKSQLDAQQAELQKQSAILSDSARKQKEDTFQQQAMEFQSTYSRYEGEMQQAYYSAMEQFIDKMKKIAVVIGTERGYTMVVEATEGGVVYSTPSIDITDELIKRYNAANPAGVSSPAKKP